MTDVRNSRTAVRVAVQPTEIATMRFAVQGTPSAHVHDSRQSVRVDIQPDILTAPMLFSVQGTASAHVHDSRQAVRVAVQPGAAINAAAQTGMTFGATATGYPVLNLQAQTTMTFSATATGAATVSVSAATGMKFTASATPGAVITASARASMSFAVQGTGYVVRDHRRVHAIICTYLGDGELDIGKTARWVQYFVDSMYFYDANSTSLARKYVVDYARSFPDCKVGYHPASAGAFYTNPEITRRMAFQKAQAEWAYDDDDWVIYVDGTEGLSTAIPQEQLELVEPNTPKFRYLYDEADKATAPYMAVPYRVFTSQGPVTEHTFSIRADLPATDPSNQALWWSCDPHYSTNTNQQSTRRLMRMFQVGYLRGLADTDPMWAKMDRYDLYYAPPSNIVSLIGYSYARFSEIDYFDPSLWVEANDLGFANRLFMDQVPGRQVVELPTVYATPDPPGYAIIVPPGPASIIAYPDPVTVTTFDFTGHVTNESGNEVYTWAWGDGSPNTTGQQLTHTFPASGAPFTVTLTVHDPDVPADRTVQVIINPGTYNPVTHLDPATPADPLVRMLSPPYCYYVNTSNLGYIRTFVGLWRRNPRDGVFWTDIGPVPVSPTTGSTMVDPLAWNAQPPIPNPTPTVPDQKGAGV